MAMILVTRDARAAALSGERAISPDTTINYRSIGTTDRAFRGRNISVEAGDERLWLPSDAELPPTLGRRGDALILDAGGAGEEVTYILERAGRRITLQGPVSRSFDGVSYRVRRAFGSIDDWERERGGNLVRDDRVEVGLLYNDGVFRASEDSALATIDGSRTDPGHFMWLRAADGHGHDGTARTGVLLDGRNETKHGIRVRDDHTVIEGIELIRFRSEDGASAIKVRNARHVLLDRLLVHDFDDLERDRSATGVKGSDRSDFKLQNSIIYDGDVAAVRTNRRGGTATIRNCTILGMQGRGVYEDEGVYHVYNTISVDNDRGRAGGPDFDIARGTQSHNLSSDGSGDGPIASADELFVSLQRRQEDLHLRGDLAGAALAIDGGADLSALFPGLVMGDIDGQARPVGAGWDIGADEHDPSVHSPLELVSAELTPTGTPGEPATLRITVRSSRDVEQGVVWVLVPPGVSASSDALTWRGALAAGTAQLVEVPLTVNEPGPSFIALGIHAEEVKANGAILASDTRSFLYSISTSAGGEVRLDPVGEIPSLTAAPELHGTTEVVPSPPALTVRGEIFYSAESQGCGDLAQCPRGLLPARPLRHARLELWHGNSLPVAGGITDENGRFVILVSSPLAGGTNPHLRIYASDGAAVTIYPELYSDHPYWIRYPASGALGEASPEGEIDIGHISLAPSPETQALHVFEQIRSAQSYLASGVGWQPASHLAVRWPSACMGVDERACTLLGQTYLPDGQGYLSDAISSAYAHFVASDFRGNGFAISTCRQVQGKGLLVETSPECAWAEGWAVFVSLAARNATLHDGLDVESGGGAFEYTHPNYLPAHASPPFDRFPIVTAASLLDIFDGGSSEGHDLLADGLGAGGSGIWPLSTASPVLPQNVHDFLDRWEAAQGASCTMAAIFAHHLVQASSQTYSLEVTISGGGAPAAGWSFPVGAADSGAGWHVNLHLGRSWGQPSDLECNEETGENCCRPDQPENCKWRGHLAEDWFKDGYADPPNELDEPVYAAAAGEVVVVRQNCGDYVDVVVIRHVVDGQNVYSLYGHLEADDSLEVGQAVDRRQQIGVIGDPRPTFEPHLHFSVMNETAYLEGPHSDCSDALPDGQFVASGYSGTGETGSFPEYYDPEDDIQDNRFFHPTNFVGARLAPPDASGTVSLSPEPMCPGGGYQAGTLVTLTAAPAPGMELGHWSGDASGSANPTTVSMNSDKHVTAHFIDFVPPADPSGVVATGGVGQIQVSWVDNSINEDGYLVRAFDSVGASAGNFELPANQTSHVLFGHPPGTVRCFQVLAFRDQPPLDRVYSNPVPAGPNQVCATTTGLPPGAPASVTPSGIGPNTIRLTWQDTATNEDGFRVRVYMAPTLVLLDTVTIGPNPGTGQTVWDLGGLAPETGRCFQVQSFNSFGESSWIPASASDACATTPASTSPPAAPSGVAAQGITTDSVEVTWTDSSEDEDGFRVRVFNGSGTLLETVLRPANATSHTVSGLASGTERCFQVQSYNGAGESAWVPGSPTLACASPDSTPPPSPPDPPSNVSASGTGTSTVQVSWTDNSGNEDGFRVEVYDANGFHLATATTSANATSHTVGGLDPGTERCFRVQSHNGNGGSVWVPGSPTAVCASSDQTPPAPASITVLSPNGGETLFKGLYHTVTWSRQGDVPRVGVYLFKNGSFLRPLTPDPANCVGVDADSFSWYVPYDLDDSFSYQIKVERLPDGECNGSPDVSDLSDSVFRICDSSFCPS